MVCKLLKRLVRVFLRSKYQSITGMSHWSVNYCKIQTNVLRCGEYVCVICRPEGPHCENYAQEFGIQKTIKKRENLQNELA